MTICKRGVAIIAAGLATIALLAGCAATTTDDVARSAGAPTSSPTPQPLPSADPLQPDTSARYQQLPLQTATILPDSGATSLDSMPWKFLSVSADGRSIQVAYIAGAGCETPLGFSVTRSDSAVTIAALSRPDKTAAACADYVALGKTKLELPEPLKDGVQLVHAPVAAGWSSPNLLQ